jgi:hypothetical protein
LLLAHTLDPRFFDPQTGNDVWFEGDLGRIADEMTHRRAEHSRSNVHPLFPLITVPAAYVLRAFGVGGKGPVVAVVGLSAAVWTASFWVLVRSLGAQRPDAAIMLLLATISAAGQFWLAVPETAALASASVMCAVAVGVYAAKRLLHDRWMIAVSVGSLAITVTNWDCRPRRGSGRAAATPGPAGERQRLRDPRRPVGGRARDHAEREILGRLRTGAALSPSPGGRRTVHCAARAQSLRHGHASP